ncbi:hypothetical protein B4116_1757 [Bacillus cereus]|nr:hypothetical protein B4085_5511 [Bacillus cereus]KZD64190.1 hypothetical protein B4116_1757 [Bacillus cereus]
MFKSFLLLAIFLNTTIVTLSFQCEKICSIVTPRRTNRGIFHLLI